MVTRIIILLVALSVYICSFGQEISTVKTQKDSIIHIKEADFSYYIFSRIKYASTGEIKLKQSIKSLDNVHTLIFNGKDSLVLLSKDEQPAFPKLKDICEVSKYKYRFSPVLGALIGGVAGSLIGGLLGYAMSSGDSHSGETGPFSSMGKSMGEAMAVAGGVVLGFFGGLGTGIAVTIALNTDTLDLFPVPEKDKRSELIKFLRQK